MLPCPDADSLYRRTLTLAVSVGSGNGCRLFVRSRGDEACFFAWRADSAAGRSSDAGAKMGNQDRC